MVYQVNNVSTNFRNYKYVVVRDCKEDVKIIFNGNKTKRYWYWGSYNDLMIAQQACMECGNGFVVESENIKALGYSGW